MITFHSYLVRAMIRLKAIIGKDSVQETRIVSADLPPGNASVDDAELIDIIAKEIARQVSELRSIPLVSS